MHSNDPPHPRMLDDHMNFMVWDDYVFGKRNVAVHLFSLGCLYVDIPLSYVSQHRF